MSRWTKEEKEWQGYRRQMAYRHFNRVTLPDNPWDKKEEEDERARREAADHGPSDTKRD
jgi:hypothetical protein